MLRVSLDNWRGKVENDISVSEPLIYYNILYFIIRNTVLWFSAVQ